MRKEDSFFESEQEYKETSSDKMGLFSDEPNDVMDNDDIGTTKGDLGKGEKMNFFSDNQTVKDKVHDTINNVRDTVSDKKQQVHEKVSGTKGAVKDTASSFAKKTQKVKGDVQYKVGATQQKIKSITSSEERRDFMKKYLNREYQSMVEIYGLNSTVSVGKKVADLDIIDFNKALGELMRRRGKASLKASNSKVSAYMSVLAYITSQLEFTEEKLFDYKDYKGLDRIVDLLVRFKSARTAVDVSVVELNVILQSLEEMEKITPKYKLSLGYKYLRIFCVFIYHKNFKDASILASLILCQIKASFSDKSHAFDGTTHTRNIYTGKEHEYNTHKDKNGKTGWGRKTTDPWSRTRDTDYGNTNHSNWGKQSSNNWGQSNNGWGRNNTNQTNDYGIPVDIDNFKN